MSQLLAPHRADIVGSFLRPARLHEARTRFAAGQIDAAQLKQVEDECITALIERQLAAGLQVITDGAGARLPIPRNRNHMRILPTHQENQRRKAPLCRALQVRQAV